jgi:hypothetical protein
MASAFSEVALHPVDHVIAAARSLSSSSLISHRQQGNVTTVFIGW